MITRRGFLIASASIIGGWPFIDVVASRFDQARGTLFVIDARLASIGTPCVNDDNRANPSVLRLDGDIAELWQRVIRPVLVRQPPSHPNPRERCASSIDGWTSHADSFVLSTLCAEYGFAYRALPDAANPISRVASPTDASFDVVSWRLARAGQ